MTTTNPTGQKQSGTTATTRRGIDVDVDHLRERLGIDCPADVQRLGVDGAGEVHYHSPSAAAVWVVDGDDGTVTHVADHTARSVWQWVDHVREERGEWTALNYDRSLGAALARTVQRAQEASR